MQEIPGSAVIFDRFIDRLVCWIVGVQQSRVSRALTAIADAASAFFYNMNIMRTNRYEVVRAQAQQAAEVLRRFENAVVNDVRNLIASLPKALRDQAQKEEIRQAAMEAAVAVRLEHYDGKSRLFNQDEATGALKEMFADWLRDQVVLPVLHELREKITRSVDVQARAHLLDEAIRTNALLMQALRDRLSLETDFENILGIFGGIGSIVGFVGGIVAAIYASGIGAGILVFFGVWLGGGVLIAAVGAAIAAIWATTKKIDADFKRSVASHMLDQVGRGVDPSELQREAEAAIRKIFGEVQREIARRAAQAQLMADALREAELLLPRLRLRFGKLEASAIALRARILLPSTLVIQRDRQLGHGLTGTVFAGRWCGQDVAVKVLAGDADMDIKRMFFEEVHYARVLADSTAPARPCLLRFQAVYEADEPAGEWHIVYPRYYGSLFDHLEAHIARLSSMRSRSRWTSSSALLPCKTQDSCTAT